MKANLKLFFCWAVFFALVEILLGGCAGSSKRIRTITIPADGVAVLSTIPSPRAGLVIPINKNEGAWANCILYEGGRSQDDIIGIGSNGNPILNDEPLLKFEVGSAVTGEVK